jgi:hypothetical protein
MTATVPPARRGRRWRSGFFVGVVLTAAVGVVVAVALIFVPAVGAIGFLRGSPSLDDANSAAERYLDEIEAGADADAYARLCPDLQGTISPEQFTATVESAPRPQRHKITAVRASSENNRSADAGVQLYTGIGAGRHSTIKLRHDDSGWRICGEPYI